MSRNVTDFRQIHREAIGKDTEARYSRALREMFNRINPYNLSCLYKEPFESHAALTLKAQDRQSEACAASHTRVTDRLYDPCTERKRGPCHQTKPVKEPPDLDTPSDDPSASHDEGIRDMADVYKELSFNTECSNQDICGWDTCPTDQELLRRALAELEPKPSNEGPPTRSNNRKSVSDSQTKNSFSKTKKKSSGDRSFSATTRKNQGGNGTKNQGGNPSKKDSQSNHSNVSNRHSRDLVDRERLDYPFQHFKHMDLYIEQYRNECTYRLLERTIPDMTRLLHRDIDRRPPTTATLQCLDVACIAPRVARSQTSPTPYPLSFARKAQRRPPSPMRPFSPTRVRYSNHSLRVSPAATSQAAVSTHNIPAYAMKKASAGTSVAQFTAAVPELRHISCGIPQTCRSSPATPTNGGSPNSVPVINLLPGEIREVWAVPSIADKIPYIRRSPPSIPSFSNGQQQNFNAPEPPPFYLSKSIRDRNRSSYKAAVELRRELQSTIKLDKTNDTVISVSDPRGRPASVPAL